MGISCRIGDRQVDFHEVSDVAAVPIRRAIARYATAEIMFDELRLHASSAISRSVDADRETFEQAGWLFAHRDDATMKAVRSMLGEASEGVVQRVVLNDRNQTLVTTRRLTVRFPAGTPDGQVHEVLEKYKLRMVRRLRFAEGLYEVAASGRDGLDAAVMLQEQSAQVDYAEPQFLQVIGGRHRPTDPRYSMQWQWFNNGSSGGAAGADIRAEAAWNRTRGANTRIAVIDNGMDVSHPDLASAIDWGGYFDDDGTGSGPFVPYPSANASFPGGHHGTFCMGMAGARESNGVHGCGAAPDARLFPIACLPDQVGTQTTLARAIACAADPALEDPAAVGVPGADVIACSLGPNSGDWNMESVLKDAIDYAVTRGRQNLGTPIFWAVSNGEFPVAHDEVCAYSNTIAVGRSNRLDLEDGSAYGPELDFLAPGVEVASTEPGNGFGIATGTSFAAPCAAGVGALVISRFPSLSAADVRLRLRSTCDQIGPGPYVGGRNDRYGFGRINADRATQ